MIPTRSSSDNALLWDDFTGIDSSSDTEEILNSDANEENELLYLTKMEYSEAEALIIMEICGLDSSIAELTDFICAAQMAKAADALLPVEDRKPLCNVPNYKKRQNSGYDFCKGRSRGSLKKITQRTLPEDAIGLPYFYFENVELAPVGVWTKMSRYLYDVGRNKVDPLEPDEEKMLLVVQRLPSTYLGILLKTDVQELNGDWLEQLMSRFGGFDLVVGGIHCNNLTGRNKHHRGELEDFCWYIFLE
ncbi:DNA (Cytosine-5)-methyltransferase DRM1/2 isoform 2 [Hibiscus syriacus]|uniref:DNA (Cytosine-5)-methyltransferase DRM1/2 isoform 2 n=1 Tax=Hibiscus syriacus TaxID=106335 RepID=A0A6A2Y7Y1_HIBSY|nr:DNA (Cytosine-5)-methyltransferase DRM1/2 isoform 2 [Hibiscus syriacus]